MTLEGHDSSQTLKGLTREKGIKFVLAFKKLNYNKWGKDTLCIAEDTQISNG